MELYLDQEQFSKEEAPEECLVLITCDVFVFSQYVFAFT